MANQYVNKVELADGTSLIDISSDTVTAGSMLSGVTAHDKSGASVTGNIASKSSSDLTASTLTVTAPAGYYASSASKTLSDENLVAGNIKKNVEIFGVTGTYEGGGGGTETIIIPEQTVTASSAYTQLQYDQLFVLGEEYEVTVNGTTKTITAEEMYGSVALRFVNQSQTNYIWFEISGNNVYLDLPSALYGTYTVKVVQKSGGGSTLIEKTITANGVYNASDDNADGYSKVTVNVSGGGGGLVYETGTYTPASDIAKPTISFANTHTTLPMFIMFSDAKGDVANTTNTGLSFYYMYHERVFGQPVYITSSSLSYGNEFSRYKASSASSSSNGSNNITASDTYSGGTTGTSYPRYYTTESEFYPYANSSSRYWRSGRTYKWIAVWAPTA